MSRAGVSPVSQKLRAARNLKDRSDERSSWTGTKPSEDFSSNCNGLFALEGSTFWGTECPSNLLLHSPESNNSDSDADSKTRR
jgi:hypothetical protein